MRQLINQGWKFAKFSSREEYEARDIDGVEFTEVNVPHDFAIEKFSTFYEDAFGVYKRELDIANNSGSRVILYFDAIYMDSTIYMNGDKIFEWKYGYTPFEIDITQYIRQGINDLTVTVDYKNPNSRWYSGAGILRNVWIDEVPAAYIPRYGIYVNATKNANDDNWILTVDTEIIGADFDTASAINLEHTLTDEAGNSISLQFVEKSVINDFDKEYYDSKDGITCRRVYTVNNPEVWDIETPNVYTIRASFGGGNTEETLIGFRTIMFDPDRGFLLNNRTVKLNGVCEHHDFGMMGGIFYSDAAERKILKLKSMGVNAIRTSHNPVDPMAIELCDRLGVLVLSEGFDMWENSKTTYDYGRFFPEWYKKDVRAWVRQERNHPSVIMWSVGNEIYDLHLGERGRQVLNNLTSAVRKNDYLHNAYTTFGSNYMPWENAQRAANDVEVVGYNYAEKFYKEHHRSHPDWVIYGSETCSIVYSRGVYHFPLSMSCMTDDDGQCSCMGNSSTSWGAEKLEVCVCEDRDMEFSCGQFIWTGHDYLGEPTPYHSKNSYFGAIDTAGFEKDAYYVWRSAWTDGNCDPFIYVSPNWDYNIGETVDIRVMSNAYEVELFVNGTSLGRKRPTHKPGTGMEIVADYQAMFTPGNITAVAYNESGERLCECVRKSYGDTCRIVVKEEKFSYRGQPYELGKYNIYGNKLRFFDIYALDEDGNVVENADDFVDIKVLPGYELVCCDNGDSTDYADQKCLRRRLFNGRLLVVVRSILAENQPSSAGDLPCIEVTRCLSDIPVRRIDLLTKVQGTIGPDSSIVPVRVKIYPENATDKELEFRVTDKFGNNNNIAEIIENNYAEDGTILVKAIGDGEFNLRAFSKCGTGEIRIISQLRFKARGLGAAFRNPYEFISASSYSDTVGEITNGNERGISTSRECESAIIFDNIDFGENGSEKVIIPIFSLENQPKNIDIYDGRYGTPDCRLLCAGIYDKPSIWNVYQEEEFALNTRLTGIHSISLRAREKYHIKGFVFEEYNRAFDELQATEAKRVYGDTYTICEDMIAGIGNNVTVEFGTANFGPQGAAKISICGRARGNMNSLHLIFKTEDGEVKNILEENPTPELTVSTHDVSGIAGKGKISLVYLPGCDYDLKWIRFER